MPHRLRRFRKKEFAYASSETSEAAELSLSEATEAAEDAEDVEDVEAVLELFFEPLSEP